MNRLFVNALKSVGLVGVGDDPEATVTFWKSKDFDKRDFSTDQREEMASAGTAMADGSYPIANRQDLRNAIQAYGRAKNKTATKAHIIKRARALGAVEMLPDDWQVTKVLTSAESAPGQGEQMPELDLSAIESEDIRKAIESALASKDAEIADLQAQLTPEEDPVDKADPEVQAILKAQAEELSKVKDELAAEKKTRRLESFIAKAEPFTMLLGKADEMGPVLEELEAAAPEAYGKLESALTAGVQRSELAELFKTLGHEGESESDPIAARDAWVEKNKEDGESVYTARQRFWKAHPEMRS